MFQTTSDAQMKEKAKLVIEHLIVESEYLDSVIESSLEIQSLLRDRQTFSPSSYSPPATKLCEGSSIETINHRAHTDEAQQREQVTRRLTEIRKHLAGQFLPVMEGRRAMVETMNSIDPKQQQTPSVTALTLKVDEPLRGQLKQLRNEIRSKLNKVQSIAMGNQAILVYTMDFYNRLLTGLSRDQRPSSYYNATGKTQNHLSINLIETNC